MGGQRDFTALHPTRRDGNSSREIGGSPLIFNRLSSLRRRRPQGSWLAKHFCHKLFPMQLKSIRPVLAKGVFLFFSRTGRQYRHSLGFQVVSSIYRSRQLNQSTCLMCCSDGIKITCCEMCSQFVQRTRLVHSWMESTRYIYDKVVHACR